MEIVASPLPGVSILTPKYFQDNRGYFSETYSKRTLAKLGIEVDFIQENHSLSVNKNTLRGIHYQINPRAQAKLVRCIKGGVLDCVIDLRKDSPYFKKWIFVELTEENHTQVFIPVGFGHAFLTLTDNCEVLYKASEFYYPEFERSIAWDDPDIGIAWQLNADPIMSNKDMQAPSLKNSDVNFWVGDDK